MWWAIGIIGVVCVTIFLLIAWAKSIQGRLIDQDFVLERIAKEYLARRQKGETMDQIKGALYEHYSISKPVQFWSGYYNPLPFGNLTFAGVTKQMPEDARCLGEITYSILCNRGIYPTPRERQGPRDSACEYDAMTKIFRKCRLQMVVSEAMGKKVGASLWEMMKKWSALDDEIAFTNAQWEKWFQKNLRKPEWPKMQDKIEGIDQSEGLFGTKWLMPMDQVLQIIPETENQSADRCVHFGKYHGRRATFIYCFENNLLAKISVCLNKSSEKEFNRMQARLSADFGTMPSAAPAKYYQLLSKGEFGGLEIEHWLDDVEQAGITEMINFRKTT